MSLKDKLQQREQNRPDTLDITPGHAVPMNIDDDRSDEWHAARRKGIGGSDVATIMGWQPYGTTRPQLWREKTGREERKLGNAAVRYGRIIEEHIRRWLTARAADTPAIYGKFDDLIDYPVQCRHPDHTWARGNVDGLLVRDGEAYAGVEIKQSSRAHGSKKLDWRDGGVMAYHYPQIQHYMWVYGLPTWHYVYFEAPADREFTRLVADEFIPDTAEFWQWIIDQGTLTHREVDRDEQFITEMVGAERDFWAHVEDDTEPDEWLPDGEVEVDDPRLAELLDEYGRIKAQMNAAKPDKTTKERKSDKLREIRQRCQELAVEHGEPKKLHFRLKQPPGTRPITKAPLGG